MLPPAGTGSALLAALELMLVLGAAAPAPEPLLLAVTLTLRGGSGNLTLMPPSFVSVTVDYMPGVGILDLDLEDPALHRLASGLAPGLAPGYVCKGNLTQCLTADRWVRWLHFANATGLHPVLGLNGCFGRQSRSAPLNSSNAAALLLAFSAKHGAGQPFSVELGNEMSECVAGTARWSPYNCTSIAARVGWPPVHGARTWGL